MKKYGILICTGFVFLFLSCREKKHSDLLDIAEKYLYYKTDSTFYYLSKIADPEKLGEYEWARYQLLWMTGKFNNLNMDLSDELLKETMRIMKKHGDSTRIAENYFRLGRQYFFVGELDKADSLFHCGVPYLNSPESFIWYNIYMGYSKYYQSQPEQALLYHREALSELEEEDSYLRSVIYGDMGEDYNALGKMDSAVYYYELAIRVAETLEIDPLLALYHKSLGKIYQNQGLYAEAFDKLSRSIMYQTGRRNSARNLFMKGKIFLEIGEKDSARVYLQRAVQTPNVYVANQAYHYLSKLYISEGKDSLAFATLHLQNDHFDHLSRNGYFDTQSYQDDILRFENNELKIRKQQQDLYGFVLVSVLILIFMVTFFLYINQRRNKLLKENQLKKELLENELKQTEQDKQIAILKERTTSLREQLFRRLAASQKIPSLSGNGLEPGSLKSRLSDEELEELIQTVNKLWPGFADHLQEKYPLLRPKDIAFCCLMKCGISVKDLASIYYVTPSAISQKKSRMKKEKFGVLDENVTLEDLLDELI